MIDSIIKIVRGIFKVRGNTDNTLIGNQNDALKTSVQGADGVYTADVTRVDGVNRLNTTGLVQIENLLGQDPIPDAYFTIDTAGAIGDTVRVQVASTTNDSTSPDSDLPAVDVTYILVAEDVGDERKLAKNIATALNADANFTAAFLDADAISGDKRPVVHVTSKEFSLSGEFHERPNPGDFSVTTTGTTTATISDGRLISRGKSTSLARDPSSPHRLGILGIAGQVTVRADAVDKLFFADAVALLGGSSELAVNGPATFVIPSNPAGGNIILLETLKFIGTDGNIKVGPNNFLGLNSTLLNGIQIDIYQNGSVTTLPLIKTTNDLLGGFSSGANQNKIISQSGGDYIESQLDLVAKNVLIKLEPGTTDRVEVIIQDDLTSISTLKLTTQGFEEEP